MDDHIYILLQIIRNNNNNGNNSDSKKEATFIKFRMIFSNDETWNEK